MKTKVKPAFTYTFIDKIAILEKTQLTQSHHTIILVSSSIKLAVYNPPSCSWRFCRLLAVVVGLEIFLQSTILLTELATCTQLCLGTSFYWFEAMPRDET